MLRLLGLVHVLAAVIPALFLFVSKAEAEAASPSSDLAQHSSNNADDQWLWDAALPTASIGKVRDQHCVLH